MGSVIWGPQVGQWTPVDSPTCPMVQWDRMDSGIGWTVGYGGPQMGQWTPMDSPTCPMVQWDRMGSGDMGALRRDSGLPWRVPPVLMPVMLFI